MTSSSRTVGLSATALLILALALAGCGDDDGGGDAGGPGDQGGGSGGSGGGAGGAGGDGGGGPDECPCDPNEHCDTATNLCEPGCRADADCAPGDVCNTETSQCETPPPPCTRDDMCGPNTGLRCDLETGDCVPADDCEGDFTCPNTTVCPDIESCVCVADTTQPHGGSCWRRRNVCETCATDEECGDSQTFDKPRECVSYNFGGTPANVCLPRRGAGSCPAGTIPGNAEDGTLGHCVPQTGDCAALRPCDGDEDCTDPAAPVCDRARQICIPGCEYNFETQRTDGCAPGKVCHAKPEYLQAQLLSDCATVGLYGIGRCDDPCESDADCTGIDPSFVCRQDGAERRCRPDGCLDDRECPEGAGDFRGYCDPNTFSCQFGNCRTGPDPRNGCGAEDPYQDCAVTHKCVEDASQPLGYGVCILKNCIDNGGAALDCRIGQFCAGEPMKDLLTGQEEGSPLTPPAGVPVGVCYDMDTPAWCASGCGASEDCRAASIYGDPNNPDWCLFDLNGDGAGECTWGCEYGAQCPGRWGCSSAGLEVQCEGLRECQADADCGAGNRCVDLMVNGRVYANWPQGVTPFRVCECSDTDACPAGFTCNDGIGTMGLDPADEATFEQVQARYCAASTGCGDGGSCEFYGKYNQPAQQGDPPTPKFQCGCGQGTAATCPTSITSPDYLAEEASRCGTTVTDRFFCVGGQMCQPRLYTDSNGDQVCGVPP